MKPLINWIDTKHMKEELPKTKGHFVQIVRTNDVENALILLFEIIRKPIPENAKMQKPVLEEERKRVIEAIETSFNKIITEDIDKLRR